MDAVAAKAPANPFGAPPARRANSIRRTSTIDTSWPDGFGQASRMQGRARDLVTLGEAGEARVLAEDWTDIVAAPGRLIAAIETSRCGEAARELVGARGGGHLRQEISRLLPEEQAKGSPLHLLLDDFSGASLVAGWGLARWDRELVNRIRAQLPKTGPGSPGRNGSMANVCAGFRPGSSALQIDGASNVDLMSATRVPSLADPADPWSWHGLAPQEGYGARRARRIDVWFEEVVRIDVGFQDSATSRDGGERIAVHEYQVSATADPETFELLSIVVDPRILPFPECPAASPNAERLLGAKLQGFRLAVLETLPGTLGCTHLNDLLRSMADAPQLARNLKAALQAEPA
ncbi:MAG: DUF2889 domain-containing protein [Caulobacteraceae bacterium]|nr:DUF2889 domain-containing protein [Caulobacteraceae bacterium]